MALTDPITGLARYDITGQSVAAPTQSYEPGSISGFKPSLTMSVEYPKPPVLPDPVPESKGTDTAGMIFPENAPATAPAAAPANPTATAWNLSRMGRGLTQAGNAASQQGGPSFSGVGGGLGGAVGALAGGPVGAAVGQGAGAVAGGILDWWIGARDAEQKEAAAKRQEAETRRWQEMYMTRQRTLDKQSDQQFAQNMSATELANRANKAAMAEKYRAAVTSVMEKRANRAGYGVADNVVASPFGNPQARAGLAGAF